MHLEMQTTANRLKSLILHRASFDLHVLVALHHFQPSEKPAKSFRCPSPRRGTSSQASMSRSAWWSELWWFGSRNINLYYADWQENNFMLNFNCPVHIYFTGTFMIEMKMKTEPIHLIVKIFLEDGKLLCAFLLPRLVRDRIGQRRRKV